MYNVKVPLQYHTATTVEVKPLEDEEAGVDATGAISVAITA